MKTLFKLILASIILVGFSQCGNFKNLEYKFEKKTPFKVKEATYQSWVAGIQGGGAGITIIITLENIDTISDTDFFKIEDIIFRNQILKPEIKQNPLQFIGRYKSDINQPKEYVMLIDSVEAYKGFLPPIIENATYKFNLMDDEAVISYIQHGKLKYYKLKLSKKDSEYYQ